jgi:hypothetical protein
MSDRRQNVRLGAETLNHTYSKLDTVATFFPAKEETSYTNWTEAEATKKISGQFDGSEDAVSAQEQGHASHKPPSKTVFSPADLRDEIYDDMNGGENLCPDELVSQTI